MNERNTMRDVDHTHPHTGQPFGRAYRRGPAVADGGRGDGSRPPMREIDHAPSDDGLTNRVWARGERSTAPGDEESTDE